ncbi:hypothetical protein EDD86DRAFT_97509 [Gorgonomyces haynaldii]|nr:hypothetical protein EDD86DRAFT_97509 [Gorgonomyces haynaldii]
MFKQPVDRVKFNVGGISMETERINVLKHPSSKLFEIISAQEPKTVFIDMNPLVFLTILDYFRTGKCYLPSNVNQDLLVLSFRSLGIPVPLEMIPSRPIGFEQTHDNAPPAYQDLMGPTLTQLDDILRTTMPILYMHLSRGTHRLRLIYHTLNDRSFLNDPRVPLDNYPLEDIRLGKMDPPLSFLLYSC